MAHERVYPRRGPLTPTLSPGGRGRRALATLATFVALATPAPAALAQGTEAAPAPAPAPAAATEDLTTLPQGKGLPVVVRVGLFFADIGTIDENEGAFEATVDLRLRWSDPRLRYPPEEAPSGFKELRAEAAEAKLAEIWDPDVALANLSGEPSDRMRGLRLYPDGTVQVVERTAGKFKTAFDVRSFPFDRQTLSVEVVARREPAQLVSLEYRQDDLDYSRVASGVRLDDWAPGFVSIRRERLAGWYGERLVGVVVGLEVARKPATAIAPVFLPLFASLLIPLLALWMQKVEDADFQIEAFELANVLIGGLFAVIALNFTVASVVRPVAFGDNTVTRLFGLNYLALGVNILINVTMFRFNLLKRAFGKYVQEQVFLYSIWAMPVLAIGSAFAIVLAAAVS